MKISILREIYKLFATQSYFESFIHGGYDAVLGLQHFLDNNNSIDDDYEITAADWIELYTIFEAPNSLSLADAIKSKMNTHEVPFNVLNQLKKNNLLTKENVNHIIVKQLYQYYDMHLDQLFENEFIQDVLKQCSDPIRQSLYDVFINLKSHNIKNDRIITWFKLIQNNNILNETTLALIQKNNYYEEQFLIFELLSQLKRLNDKMVNLLSNIAHGYHHSVVDVLNRLITINQPIGVIDENLIASVLSIKQYYFENLTQCASQLSRWNFLTKNNMAALVHCEESLYKIQDVFNWLEKKQMVPTQVMIEKVLSDKVSNLYLYEVITRFDEQGVDITAVFDSIIDQHEDLYKLFRSLTSKNCLTKTKIECIVTAMSANKIASLCKIISASTKWQAIVLTDEHFSTLCNKMNTKKLAENIDKLPPSSELFNKLCMLNDQQFAAFNEFIEDNYWDVRPNQDIFDRLSTLVRANNQLNKETVNEVTQEKIFSITQQFYPLAQRIIEKYYLQPYKGKKAKSNLKDGDIEREVHGAMHAARVSIYVNLLHQFLLKLLPEEVTAAIKKLADFYAKPVDDIISAIKIAGLSHDSMREDEYEDKWDAASGLTCKQMLESYIGNPLAELLGNAIAYKDKPDAFEKYLLSIGIDKSDVTHFDYARQLIYLADCFDIMRCNTEFKLIKIINCLKTMPGFNETLHLPMIIELTKQLYYVIKQQQDLLFACKIIMPDGSEIPLGDNKPCYDLKTKVSLEHADNATAVIAKEIKAIPYFAEYLQNETIPDASPAVCKPVYNPYLHGTTSLLLATLEQTGNKVMPISDMLTHFKLAPFGGEINKKLRGGFYHGKKICFGKLNTIPARGGNEPYDLKRITKDYAGATEKTPDIAALIELIKTKLEREYKNHFVDITVLNIYLARAKQLGINKETLSKEINYDDLKKQLNAVIQALYLITMIGHQIKVNELEQPPADISLGSSFPVYNDLYYFFTFQKLVSILKNTSLNIKAIQEDGTKEALEKIVTLLNEEMKNTTSNSENERKPMIHFSVANLNDSPSLSIDGAIAAWLKEVWNKSTAREFSGNPSLRERREKILNYIAELEQNSLVLDAIMQHDHPALTARQAFFMNNCFPLVIVAENQNNMYMFRFDTNEHRTPDQLLLGKDIKTLATDTPEHCLIIMKYLEENHINNVSVIQIAELYLSDTFKVRPESRYQHDDGFPRLSWLAARAVPGDNTVKTKDAKANRMLEDAEVYNKLKLG